MNQRDFKIEWLLTILRAEGVGELSLEEQELLFQRIREESNFAKAKLAKFGEVACVTS